MLLAAGVGDIALCDRVGRRSRSTASDLTDVKADLAERTQQGGLCGLAVRRAARRRRVHRRLGGHGAGRGRLHDGAATRSCSRSPTPTPRSTPTSRTRPARRWSPPGAATSRTRSTTCSRSPASSAARSTSGATRITEGMKLAAAEAIAGLVGDDLAPDHIVPDPFDPRLARDGRARGGGGRGRRRRRPRRVASTRRRSARRRTVGTEVGRDPGARAQPGRCRSTATPPGPTSRSTRPIGVRRVER